MFANTLIYSTKIDLSAPSEITTIAEIVKQVLHGCSCDRKLSVTERVPEIRSQAEDRAEAHLWRLGLLMEIIWCSWKAGSGFGQAPRHLRTKALTPQPGGKSCSPPRKPQESQDTAASAVFVLTWRRNHFPSDPRTGSRTRA